MLHAQFVGFLGQDCRTNEVDGTPVTNFNVAVVPGIDKDADPIWVGCALWGKRAESVSEFLVKGKRVMVTGTLTTREYKHEGEKRFSIECRVGEVELLDGGSKSDEDGKDERKNGKKRDREERASR